MPKAVWYDEFGGIEVLRVDEVEPSDGGLQRHHPGVPEPQGQGVLAVARS